MYLPFFSQTCDGDDGILLHFLEDKLGRMTCFDHDQRQK